MQQTLIRLPSIRRRSLRARDALDYDTHLGDFNCEWYVNSYSDLKCNPMCASCQSDWIRAQDLRAVCSGSAVTVERASGVHLFHYCIKEVLQQILKDGRTSLRFECRTRLVGIVNKRNIEVRELNTLTLQNRHTSRLTKTKSREKPTKSRLKKLVD